MHRRYDTFLNVYFVAVFAGIGGQMAGVDAGWLTSYGADLLESGCGTATAHRVRLTCRSSKAAVSSLALYLRLPVSDVRQPDGIDIRASSTGATAPPIAMLSGM